VFRIRIGFYEDTDPVFCLNADPNPGVHTDADPDPDPGQTLPSQRDRIRHEKYTLFR
jgi:hypothetical protein